jgi:hypothetical protein
LPEFKTINSKYSAFKANYNLKANTLELKAEHSMGKRIYEAEDWQDFRTALVERFKLMNSEIILVK